MNPEDRFDALVSELVATAGVTPPGPGSGFGSTALRIHNKIFAMLARGRLVVKLPRARVDALVAAGHGVRFDANKGTPMKEWLSLDSASDLPWLPLAGEALEHVRGRASMGAAKTGTGDSAGQPIRRFRRREHAPAT